MISCEDTRAVNVVVDLPEDLAADMEAVRKKDPDFLGRAIEYALARRIIFEELTATAADSLSMSMRTMRMGTVGVFQLNLIKSYQLDRLTAFIDPGSHELSLSYNQVQSEIAIGSGGILGKGLFEGSQTNLQFVPVQSSDFIFTAVGEQFGFIGSVIVIALFAVLLFRLLSIAVASKDRFAFLVTSGIAAMFAFHVFVNIGMTIRIMPVTGLPLPFMSAGGTVFVAMSVALGLAHSAWIRRSAPVGDPRLG